MRRKGATPRARERKEMLAERVRVAGARSEEGEKGAAAGTAAAEERVAHVDVRE